MSRAGGASMPGMSDVRPIPFVDLLSHAQAMFAAHWEEIALNKSLMVLKPDLPRYHAMDAAGMLIVLGAFVGDALVGYSLSFIAQHLHYADLRYVQNDLLFVDAAHRNSRAGLQLIRATEDAAREAGAQMVIWHAKQGTTLDALLPRLGYRVQDVMYSREV